MKTSMFKIKKKHLFAYAILTIYTLFSSIPLIISFVNAFKPRQEILTHPLSINFSTLNLQGLTTAYNLIKYPQALVNNFIVFTLSLLIMVIFGSMMGFAVAVVGSKTLRFSYMVTVLVITIPFQAIMIPIVILLNKLVLLNSYFGISMIFVATSLPVVVFMYTGFMRSLPKELCEAAIVDGCGIWRTYLNIYMPLLKMVTGTVVIIRGVGIWNDLLVCLITISDAKMTTMVYRLYSFVSNRFNQWDLVFGASLLVSLPIIVIFIALQKYFVSGVVAGAIKG